MATKIAAIPAPTDSNLKEVARAVKNVLDVREGVAGNPLDSNVTFRDLVDGGILSVSLINRGGSTGIGGVTPPDSTGYDPTKDLSIPPAPQSLVANGLFAAVAISWANPPQTFRNFAYAEVWRSATDSLGSAVRIAAVTTNSFIDYIGNAETRYYWVRFVSQADIVGPYNGTSGTAGTTIANPGLLLASLISAINSSHLATALADRINLIDGSSSLSGSVNERILAETNARISALAAEASSRTNADNLLQAQIDALSGSTGGDLSGLITAINNEIAARIAGDLAEANARQIADAAIENLISLETQARIAADAILAAANAAIGTHVGDATSGLISEYNARTLADSILSTTGANIAAGLGTSIATLLAEQDARKVADLILTTADQNIGTRIDAAVSALLNEANARVLADSIIGLNLQGLGGRIDAAITSLLAEVDARASADSIINGALAAVGATAGQAVAAVGSEVIERLTEQEALASTTNVLVASLGSTAAALVVEREARATQDSAVASQVTSLAARVDIGDSSNASAIVVEQLVRADADLSLARQTTTLSSAVSDNQAALRLEQQTRADADSATSSQTLTLAAATDSNRAGLLSEQLARADQDGAIASQVLGVQALTQTTAAALNIEQQARATADSASATQITSLAASVNIGDSSNAAALVVEQQARADADGAISSQVTTLSSATGANNAALRVEQQARTDFDSAVSSQITTLASQTAQNTAGLLLEQQTRTDQDSSLSSQVLTLKSDTASTSAALKVEQTTRADSDLAVATQVTTLSSKVDVGDSQNAAALIVEQSTRADADSAQASQITSLASSVGGGAAALVVEQNVRSTSDQSISSQVTSLSAATSSALAALQVEQIARTDQDSALSQATTTLAAQYGTAVSGILSEATARANADSAQASVVTGLQAAVTIGDQTNAAAILVEQQVRVDADQAIASEIDNLSASFQSNAAAILAEQSVRSSADQATAYQLTGLAASVGANAAAIEVEETARAETDAALSSRVTTVSAQTGAVNAALQVEQTARTDADSATSQQITTIAAQAGQTSAGLLQEQTARVESDLAVSTNLVGLNARTGANTAALVVEQDARTTATQSIASQTTALVSTTGANSAAVLQEIQSRTDGDSALASQVSAVTVSLADKASVSSLNTLSVQVAQLDSGLTAQAAQLSELTATVQTDILDVDSALQIETLVRASETEALTQQTEVLYASFAENTALIQQESQARADADDAEAAQRLILAARVTTAEGNIVDNAAAIVSEQVARASADSALSSQSSSVSTAVGANNSAIVFEQTSRSDADASTAAQVSTIGAATATALSGITAEQAARATADSASVQTLNALVATTAAASSSIKTEQDVRADATSASAAQTAILGAVAGQNAAAIFTEQLVRADQDSAINSQSVVLGATVGANVSALATEQLARSSADSATANQLNSLSAKTDTTSAAITVEQTVRSDATSALANTFASTVAALGANTSSIFYEEDVRANADSSQSALTTGLLSVSQGNSAAIVQESSTRAGSDSATAATLSGLSVASGSVVAGISLEQSARISQDSAIASQVSGLGASVASNAAALVTEQTVRANADGALSSQITTLAAESDAGAAALELEAFVRNVETETLLGQYTVKVDLNGYVSGYGLASERRDGKVESEFAVRADRFYVASPTGPGITPAIPFVVQTTATTAPNGSTISPGVYMDGAYIKNATITSAKIGSVYADVITAGYTSSVDLSGSTLVGSELYIGGTVTYEYNDPSRPSTITGIASVANPNVALKTTGAEFSVDSFKVKASASAGAATIFSVQSGNVVLDATKVYANTLSSITANLGTVTAGVVQSTDGKAKFDLTNAKIVFNNGTYMKVVGNGFGANSDLLEWFGASQSEASNFAACTTANAISYVKTSGTAGGLDAGTIAFMRGLRVGDHNGNIVLDAGTGTYADAIRNGAITISGGQLSGIGTTGVTIDNTYAPNSQNLVPNSDLAVALTPWVLGWVQNGGTDIVVGRDYPSSNWYPVGGHAFGLRRFGNALTGAIDLRLNDNSKIPVLPNTRYELSGYVASHRCDCAITVWFYDSAGTYITESANQPARSGGGTNLADWARPFLFVTTPANARTCLVGIRVSAVDGGQTDGYAWLTKMYFGQANTNQTAASPWGPAAFTGVDQLGYTGALNATKNTVTRSASNPANAATTDGDIWIDTDASPSQLVYVRAGGEWQISANYLSAGTQLSDYNALSNANITLNSDGSLAGAGGGAVTITGLGYTGALNATFGADFDSNVNNIPYQSIYTNDDSVALGFNPTFSDWTGSFPVGWGAWAGAAPTKEATIVRVGRYAVRYTATGTNVGMQREVMWGASPMPVGTFVSGAIDFYMVAFTSGTPGLLVRLYTNAAKTTYTDTAVYPTNPATLSQWQRVTWTARVGSTDQIYGMVLYVLGSWTLTNPANFTGTVIFDNVRFAFYDSSIDNTSITLNPDGSLSGAGSGAVAPFEPYHAAMWDFRGTVGPWGGVNSTASFGNDVLIQTGTATANPYIRILHGGLSIPGEIFNKVRVKYRRTVGTGAWKGHVYYTTAAHTGFTATYRKIIPAPVTTIVNGDWYISEWDMNTLTDGGTDWVTSTITGLRVDFTSSANETWEVDWVIVGRYGSGEWTFNTINPTNQLTSGNIGTYIQNLAVGTLQIGSGTITVPTIAINTSSVTTNPTTYVTLVTLNVTISSTGDATVDDNIPFVLKWAFESVGQVSGPVARSVQIRRTAPSALTVYTSSTQTRDVQDFVSGVAQTTLTAGSQHTFVLEVRGGANTINRSSLWTMAARR